MDRKVTHFALGRRGEYLARLFLEEKGFLFIRANYRTPEGEIDLIMQENDELVFVEVKTRTLESAKKYGRGALRIDREKIRRIERAGARFCREERDLCRGLCVRYDAVEVYLDRTDPKKVYVLHTPCAFGV